MYVVEGGILFKALRKEARLLWEIKEKTIVLCFWGLWFSGCLLSSLSCFSKLLFNIMNVSVVVTSFCPTKGLLLLVYKEDSTDDYVECVLKSALWWAAVLFSQKDISYQTHCFASGSCKRFSIQGRDRYQAVVVPPMEASGGKFVATSAAYAIFIRCSSLTFLHTDSSTIVSHAFGHAWIWGTDCIGGWPGKAWDLLAHADGSQWKNGTPFKNNQTI